MLASRVTGRILFEAHLIFLRFCVDQGFVVEAAKIAGYDENEYIRHYQTWIKKLEQVIARYDALLFEKNLTEDSVLEAFREFTLRRTFTQMQKGMSMSELLVQGPSLIVANLSLNVITTLGL